MIQMIKNNCISNATVKMEELLNPGIHVAVLLGHIQVRQYRVAVIEKLIEILVEKPTLP